MKIESDANSAPIVEITRTAWAVFKYCGTKTAPLRKFDLNKV